MSALSDDEVTHLLLHASGLALSDSAHDKVTAYEIASRLAELHPSEARIAQASGFVMARLGNFPGRALLRRRSTQSQQRQLAIGLEAEEATRLAENTVTVPGGQPVVLTDFQRNVYRRLSTVTSLSVSAPTSSGKSFVFVQDAVSRIIHNPRQTLVYLAPTRALIRQLTRDFRKVLNAAGLADFPVRVVPLRLQEEVAEQGTIFVLTQERLLSLMSSHAPPERIEALYVDEAQSLNDESRGVLLHAAIDNVRRYYPEAAVHFAAPLASNPEHLQGLFELTDDAGSLEDTFSPVTQNIFSVSAVDGSPSLARVSLLLEEGDIHVADAQLPFELAGSRIVLMARFAQFISKDEGTTILYCNKAAEADTVAEYLTGQLPEIDDSDLPEDVLELVNYLSEHIHSEYPLIKALKRAVAFHYGYMPSNIRARVEDLAAAGHLRYICCTSTLLQGVNLPARHLVLWKPRRGSGNPMQRPDFLNLAGRAGRLQYELHGNVWCLEPEVWEIPSYKGPRTYGLSSSFETVFESKYDEMLRVIEQDKGELDDYAATAVGKILVDHVIGELPVESSSFYDDSLQPMIGQLVDRLREIELTLPPSVYERNISLPPNRLERLATEIRSTGDLRTLVPLAPTEDDAYPRLELVLMHCWRHLEGSDNNSYKHFTWLAYNWMKASDLREIITRTIKHNESIGEAKSVALTVRSLLEEINRFVSFKFVRDIRAYLDILRYEMSRQGMEDERDKLRPVDIYLECGAYQAQVLSLLVLGLSRSTAIELADTGILGRTATPEAWLVLLRTQGLSRLTGRLSALALRELREHFAITS